MHKTISQLLAAAREGSDRVAPSELSHEMAAGLDELCRGLKRCQISTSRCTVFMPGAGSQRSKVKGQKSKHLRTQDSELRTDSAEECFQRAIAIARRQGAKSWELRATMSLGRLWQEQGKTAEARRLVAEVYEWFGDGFETHDLQQAKALLEHWS